MYNVEEQIKELKKYAGERKGEIARLCWNAAETIETLYKRQLKEYDDDRK